MPTSISSGKQMLLGAVLMAVLTAVVYAPALRGDFLLDDNTLVTESNLVRASDGLYRIWCTTDAADYWPLTNTSFWLEWRWGGLNPTSYHVTNLLLHLAAVFLIWAVLRALAIPGAFLAALLFAVHPVNVESVAWISQRKNTLAIVFFLLSILCYLRDIEQRTTDDGPRTWRWYWLSLFAFVLAMLSKGSVVVLPFVLLVLTWWLRRRIEISDLSRTAPFFLVAILLGAVNVWFQTHGFSDAIRSVTMAQRLEGAGAAVWFYLAKVLLPINLLFVYPQWDVVTHSFLWWLPMGALLAATAMLWRQRRTRYGRPLLLAWALFCIALLPVLGFADVGFMQFSLVADHYQHIALIAAVATVAAGFSIWIQNSRTVLIRSAAILLPTCTVVLLATLAWQRCNLFRSAANLYAATLESNLDCWQLHNSLATVLNRAGQYPAAVQECREALRLNPTSADAHFNLAVALGNTGRIAESIDQFQQTSHLRPARAAEIECALASILITAGRLDEAIEHCQESLQLNPHYADAHKNLGIAQLAKQQPALAIEHFRDAARLNPNDNELLNYLAGALLATGQRQLALECYEQALRLQFVAPETHYNLANLLRAAGELKEASEHYQQAVWLNPDFPEAEANLGAALLQMRRLSEAVEHLQHAAQLSPDSSDVRSNLGIALFSLGRNQESIAQFEKSLRLNSENGAAHFNLGIALAKADRLQEAADQFEQAVRLAPNNLNTHTSLISAYKQLQQTAKAIAAAQHALELARATGQSAVVRQMEDWLENLRADQVNPSPAPPSRTEPIP